MHEFSDHLRQTSIDGAKAIREQCCPERFFVSVGLDRKGEFPTKAEAFAFGRSLGGDFTVTNGRECVYEDEPQAFDVELNAAVRGPWNNCD